MFDAVFLRTNYHCKFIIFAFFFQIVDDEICEVESAQTNKSETDVKDDCTQDDFTALQASNPDEIVEVQLVVICCMLCYYTVLYV